MAALNMTTWGSGRFGVPAVHFSPVFGIKRGVLGVGGRALVLLGNNHQGSGVLGWNGLRHC